MSLCAYCGKDMNTDGFICIDCSKPDQNTISKKSPVEAKPAVDKAALVEKPATKEKLSAVAKPVPTEKQPEERKEPLVESPPKTADSMDYSDQELHNDFASQSRIAMLVLVLTPLALLATLPAIGLSSIWSFLLFFAIVNFCGFGMLHYFARKNRYKFLSWVLENTEPTELYFYTVKSATNDVVYHPVVYDEDEMFPEYSAMRNITIEHGNLELCGWDRNKPDALISATAFSFQRPGYNVVIFECKGHRLWCHFDCDGPIPEV